MAPAIACSVTECKFSTPANLSSEVALQLYLLHRKDAHGEPLPPASAQATAAATSRVERPARPSVTAGMSESEWNFFLHEWGRYTRQTGISDAVLRDELWSCMENDLRQLAFSEGFSVTTEAELLLKIKDLAVTILHPSAHVVALHQMSQQEGESVKAFGARVKGTATNCNLVKTCPKGGCDQKVSFMEETCYHVVMSGLLEQDLREKVVTQAMLNTVKDLPSLLNYVRKMLLTARISTVLSSTISPRWNVVVTDRIRAFVVTEYWPAMPPSLNVIVGLVRRASLRKGYAMPSP